MSATIPADMIDDVMERSRIRLRELASEIITRMQRPDGTTFGDVTLSRGERIARFEDYATRGVLDALKVVKPELLARMQKQYERDIQDSPFFRGAP